MDYHHVHYPDDGETLDQARVGRRLWTVNWHALLNQEDILFRNERQINILQTSNFGRLAFVEVGAMSVGRIVQVHPLDTAFRRGEEKSIFKFRARPSWYSVSRRHGVRPTICLRTPRTLVRLGEPIGLAASPMRHQ
jgi:phosphatidylserine decarboxylase